MSASTSKKNGKKDPSAVSGPMDPQAQLHEIQQLLFGQQVAEVRQSIDELSERNKLQFIDLDKKLSSSIKDLKAHFTLQLEDLTQHVNQLNQSSENRAESIEVEAASLQKTVEGFHQEAINAHNSLESQLIAEVEKLSADLESKYQELVDQLSQSSGNLNNDKLGRDTLAKLLVNMANKIEGQPG